MENGSTKLFLLEKEFENNLGYFSFIFESELSHSRQNCNYKK